MSDTTLERVRHAVVVTDWRPISGGALRGTCTVTLASGMILNDVAVFSSGGKAWAAVSKPQIGRDGNALKDDAGKTRYTQIVSFTRKELRDRFSEAVVAALLAIFPDALD